MKFKNKHIIYSFCMLLMIQIGASAEDALSGFTPVELQKKAMIKLIDENVNMKLRITTLEKRMSDLENMRGLSVTERAKEKEVMANLSKLPIYFTPHILSYVRKNPTAKAKYISSIKSTSTVEITELNCKGEGVGYWGKSSNGWIFISNPNYGTLSDKSGKHLQSDYNHWCNK